MRLTRSEHPAGSSRQPLALRDAIVVVRRDLEKLLARLPSDEAELFAPKVHILHEIEPQLLSREAAGQSREEAVFGETNCGCTDLVIDLRERLLGAIEGSPAAELGAPTPHHDADLILLADHVTPPIVAFLPRQIVAVVAALDAQMGTRRGPNLACCAAGKGPRAAHRLSDLTSSASAPTS